MKKHLTILLFLCTAVGISYAQNLTPFKVAVGVGYATPGTTGAGAGGGGLFYLEPGFRASDNVLIGLRLESAVIARGMTGVGDDDVKGDATANNSYTLNVQYYFNDNYVRPFIGAGGGLYSMGAFKFNTTGDPVDANEVKAETRVGFYPRIGIDAGHFNFSIDYNFVPRTDVPGVGQIQNNYLGIRAGLSIGGGVGRKKGE